MFEVNPLPILWKLPVIWLRGTLRKIYLLKVRKPINLPRRVFVGQRLVLKNLVPC